MKKKTKKNKPHITATKIIKIEQIKYALHTQTSARGHPGFIDRGFQFTKGGLIC